jgi:DNA-binding CsgD family transcriptional regulator/tetratricopeptide (TPR) repeat protein
MTISPEPRRSSTLPATAAQPTPGRPALIERSAQLAVLAELIVDARGGDGRLAVLRGDAGAGKTVLLRQLVREQGEELPTAIGYCDGIATPRPLSPIHDLARSLGNGLMPLLQRSASREEIRDHLLEQFGNRPVLLAIEDIQWADDATLELVQLLSRRIDETSALLVLTYREEQQPSTAMARLLGQLATYPSARQIEVPPLSRSAVAAMAAGSAVDPDVLYRLTNGNAFFTAEMLAAQAATVPRSIRDLIRGRIADLDARARAALEAAAVLGSRTEPWLLAAVAGENLPGIDDAIRAGLFMTDVDGMAFRHELTRLAVLDDLPAIRAIGLHRSVLAALRRAGIGDPARLAHHAEGAADSGAVLEYAPHAARQAIESGAIREGIAQVRRALRFATQPDALRADLLEQLGDAEMAIANGIEADEAWTEALTIRRATADDARRIGDLLRRISRAAAWRADFPRAMALAEEAVAMLEPLGESHELAMAYAGLSGQLMMEARSDEAVAWGERALAVAERLGDGEALVTALNTVGCAEIALGREDGSIKLERSLELARAHGLRFAVYRALFNLGASAYQVQRLDRSMTYFDELEQFAASTEVLGCHVDANRADVLLGLGRWNEAEASARGALDIVEGTRDPLDVSTALSVLARIDARRGGADAPAMVEQAAELLADTHDLYRTWTVVGGRAELAWLAGDMTPIMPALTDMHERAVAARDPWQLAEIARWMQRAGELPAELPTTAGAHRHALAGDWRGAADAWRQRGNPYETALALLDADEVSAVREAYDILVRLGANAVLSKAATRLRELGAPVPRGPRAATAANVAGLTEREAEVAALLAEGQSNREIAERLVVSEKTVGHHVSAVLGKLGVNRRAEVARALPTPRPPAG